MGSHAIGVGKGMAGSTEDREQPPARQGLQCVTAYLGELLRREVRCPQDVSFETHC